MLQPLAVDWREKMKTTKAAAAVKREACRYRACAGDLQREARPGGSVSGAPSGLESSVGQDQQGSLLCQPKDKGGHAKLSTISSMRRMGSICTAAMCCCHLELLTVKPCFQPANRRSSRQCRGDWACANGACTAWAALRRLGESPSAHCGLAELCQGRVFC